MRIVAGFGISLDAAYVAILQYILATYTHNIHASAMFNLPQTLTESFRPLIAESSALIKEHRETLVADFDAASQLLLKCAVRRLCKTLLISSGLITGGMLVLAGAMIFSR